MSKLLDEYLNALARWHANGYSEGAAKQEMESSWQAFLAEVRATVAAMDSSERQAYFVATREWHEKAKNISTEDYLRSKGLVA